MCPEYPRKEYRTKSFRQQSTPIGKRPKVRPRIVWRDFISDPAWSYLGMELQTGSHLGVEPADLAS